MFSLYSTKDSFNRNGQNNGKSNEGVGNLTKSFIFILFSISSLVLETSDGTVFASSKGTVPYFEDHSRRVGYKTVNEAVMEFEKVCKCEVLLPTKMPEMSFTHEFASIHDDKINGRNNILQIRFVNRKIKSNNFKLEIHKDKMDFVGKETSLRDGNKGIYFEDHLYRYLVFEKNKLQYVVGLDKNVGDIDTLEVLMGVANSIK